MPIEPVDVATPNVVWWGCAAWKWISRIAEGVERVWRILLGGFSHVDAGEDANEM
jgi:hypothetical protein